MTVSERIVEACARAAHETNRAYCMAIDDTHGMPAHWDHVSDWHRDSVMNGVRGALNGNTPEQSHQSWLEEKTSTGWRYGTVKDPDRREHPCLVPYADLSPVQRAKDELFLRVVRATAAALGWTDPRGIPLLAGVTAAQVNDAIADVVKMSESRYPSPRPDVRPSDVFMHAADVARFVGDDVLADHLMRSALERAGTTVTPP